MTPPPVAPPPVAPPPVPYPHLGRPGYGPPAYGPAPSGPPGYSPYPYGMQGRYGGQPQMLAAAADRERTLDVLKAAFMEGRLNKNEFDERSSRVLSARTYADLGVVVADLPAGPGPMMPAPYPVGYYHPAPYAGRTNGFAIGSLICGFLPFFGGIPAVVLGHVARGQIRRTGERGDGLAVAGLVLGYLWVAVWALVILIGIAHN
jgi:hypothetical protein